MISKDSAPPAALILRDHEQTGPGERSHPREDYEAIAAELGVAKSLDVLRGAVLYRQIEGWCAAVMSLEEPTA